jgi:hypothetical protein
MTHAIYSSNFCPFIVQLFFKFTIQCCIDLMVNLKENINRIKKEKRERYMDYGKIPTIFFLLNLFS